MLPRTRSAVQSLGGFTGIGSALCVAIGYRKSRSLCKKYPGLRSGVFGELRADVGYAGPAMAEAQRLPGLAASMIRGGLGFAAVGVAAFSVWVFGHGRLGTIGIYAGVAAVFLGLSVFLLHPLAGSRLRFLRAFVPGFLAYCVVWCLAWFQLGFGLGEWLGSAGGCLAFALAAGAMLNRLRAVPQVAVVLFLAHSAGYFLGGLPYYAWRTEAPVAMMLAWGFVYGLGFGAGIGYAFYAYRRDGSAPTATAR